MNTYESRTIVVCLFVAVVLAVGFNSGCGSSQASSGAANQPPASNPSPSITSISPTSATAGAAAFTLTVNGSNFISSSVVNWNGASRSTTFVGATQLTAAIAASDLASAGLTQVSVFNPGPGGGTSSAVNFSINAANNPAPGILSISPSGATAGGAAFTLTVNGNNFLSDSTVNWNGSARTTTFVSASQLMAAITAADIASAATANVTVSNPGPGGGISAAISFTIVATQQPGLLQIISVDPQGGNGNGISDESALSSDGRYAAFRSDATTLVSADTNAAPDIFLRDNCVGSSAPSPCTPVTIRVSLDAAGNQLPSGNALDSSDEGIIISADGRFVLFPAFAGDVLINPPVPATTVEYFLRDTCIAQAASCAPTTAVASVDTSGGPDDSNAFDGSLSSNGRVVFFRSNSKNLVPGVTSGTLHIYAHDTCFGVSGCTPTTILVSADSSGQEGNGESDYPAVSADGRYVAFQSVATNLVQADGNNAADLFLRDTCIGAVAGCTPSTTLITANTSGGVSMGGLVAGSISVSGDGRFVLFGTTATDLVATNTNGVIQVYLRDTCIGATGVCTPQTTLVSTDDSGNAGIKDSTANGRGLLSATGRYLAYNSLIVEHPLPGAPNDLIYARDSCFGAPAGCTPARVLISVDAQGNMVTGMAKSISGDGHYVSFDDFGFSNQAYLAATSF